MKLQAWLVIRWMLVRSDMRRARMRLMRYVRPWVHLPDDGRGIRMVTVDGIPVERVVYADTRRGLVRACHQPLRVNRRREVARTYKVRGLVEVQSLRSWLEA